MTATKETVVIDTVPEVETVGNSNGGAGRKKPTKSGRVQLRWFQLDGVTKATKATSATAKIGEGDEQVVFRIVPSKNGWKSTVRKGGKTVELAVDVKRQRAYDVIVDFYHYDRMPEVKAAPKETKVA